MRIAHINPVVRSVACYEKPLHTERLCAPDARCVFVLSGGVTFEHGDAISCKLSPGAFLYLPAGHPFRVRCEYARLLVVRFDLTDERPEPEGDMLPTAPEALRPEDVHAPADSAPFDEPILLEDLAAERDTFLGMLKTFRTGGEYAEARVGVMLKGVLVRVAENCDEQALPSRLIESLDEYIREHADEEISNTELGAMFGYHPFYISQLLKKKRGVTLHQYILSYKLRSARDSLRYTAAPIADIAASLGFSDASYFTKSFKSAFGMTPKDYRKSFEKDYI